MAEPPIANTSPIIVLAHAGSLELLRLVADHVLVPRAVKVEVDRYGPDDPAAQALARLSWLEVVDTGPAEERVRAYRLDRGEAAVLTWALRHPGTTAIIDDRAGRRCAEALGIPTRGTLGLILTAKQRGIILAARPLVERLRAAGLYLSDRTVDAALAQVGE